MLIDRRLQIGITFSIILHIIILANYNSSDARYLNSNVKSSQLTSIKFSFKTIAEPVKEEIEELKEIEKKKDTAPTPKIEKKVPAKKNIVEETNVKKIEKKQQASIPVVENASFIGERQPPYYPARSRRLGHEGVVEIMALVGVNGEILNIVVSKSSGHNLLDNSAKDAISSWRFKPTMYNGKSIKSWIKIPVEFKLK